jgi:PAS domain S-box-containing protein
MMKTKDDDFTLTADILVVDDTIESLKLLTEMLRQAGYRVRPSEKPRLALESALAQPPKLILLDVRMPEMSGFEICRRLKRDERTRDIPVIFVSALQEVDDRVYAFKVGGVDFVSKPIEESEVLARVKTHLELHTMQMHLEELVAVRTAELTQEINERALAEQEVRRSEVRFRSTFEQAAVGIAHVAPDGRFLRINQKFCDIIGYSQEEVLSLTFQDISHPDDLDSDLRQVRRLLERKAETYTIVKRYFHKQGHIVWVNLTVSLIWEESGEPKWFVSVVEDISERVQLREERDRILTTSQDLICIAGMDGYFRYLNPAWERTLGYSQAELLSRPFLDFIHPDDHARNNAEVEKLAAGKITLAFENRYISKDGTIRMILWTATLLPEEQVMYCIGQDITESKKAEQEIADYQRQLKALAVELTLVEERERRRIAADLHDHVSQTLALARVQLSTARKVDSETKKNAMFDAVSQTLMDAIQATRSLIFDLSSPLLNELGLETTVSAWLRDQIRMPYNLTTEFVDDGGEKPLTEDVRIILFRNIRELLANVVRHAQANEIKVSLLREDKDIKIIIEDDGIGFDASVATKQVHPHGGFGLFSIQERMADMGGLLEIESQPGQGARIILTAPLDMSK